MKIELHAFLTHNFHGKKRALIFFFLRWGGGGEVFVKGHLGLTFFSSLIFQKKSHINGSQLAKMKKFIPHYVTAMKFIEKKRFD